MPKQKLSPNRPTETNLKQRRQRLERLVDAEGQLRRLITLADWLGSHTGPQDPSRPDVDPPRPDQVQLAKTEIDVRMKLLNKVMYDKRAIEHSGEIDTDPQGRRVPSDTELVHRLNVLARQTGMRLVDVQGDAIEADIEPDITEPAALSWLEDD